MGARCCGESGMCRDRSKTEIQQVKLTKHRSLTDVLFFLAFIISWGVFFGNLRWCQDQGSDPNKITSGVDYLGRICGVDEGVKDKPFGAWPYPLEPFVQICVKNCYETSIDKNPYMIWSHSSTPYMGYCLPFPNGTVSVDVKVNVTMTGDFHTYFNSVGMILYRGIGDVMTCMEVIAFSGIFALLISFVYVESLRCVAGPLIAICVFLIIITGSIIGWGMWEYSKTIAHDAHFAQEQTSFLYYGAIFMWTVTGIFALVMLFLRTQVLIAIEVIKEASRALHDMKLLIFTPIIPLVCAIAYFALWLWMSLHVFSVSSLETRTMPNALKSYGLFDSRDTPYTNVSLHEYKLQEEHIYTSGGIHFFCGLWMLQFFIYMLYATIAGALAAWYFTSRDENNHKTDLPSSPICDSLCRTIRYHLGTIALAALIIAIIQTIRAFIKYLEFQMKNGGNPSTCGTAVLKMIGCCLKCVECCMDKINKNGLVWNAIYGDNFCTASCSAFALVWRNLSRVAAINTISTILLTIGKFTVGLVTMAVFGYGLDASPQYSSKIQSPVMPAIVMFVLAYLVASIFMSVFETIIDATFFCFLVDSENNEKGYMLAHPDLQRLVGKYTKASQRESKIIKLTVEDMEMSRLSRNDSELADFVSNPSSDRDSSTKSARKLKKKASKRKVKKVYDDDENMDG